MQAGADMAKAHDLSQLRFVASVGEPLNPEVVVWGQEALGLPIHDNWWQTETGGIMVANYACMDIRPGSMGRPLPGIDAAVLVRDEHGKVVVDDDGTAVEAAVGEEGELALRPGWPSMFRGYLGQEERYRSCFVGGWYLSGDLARRDEEGYFWFVGRGDDVIKSAGHLIGPFEVESTLMEHPAVAEAGVIGKPDPLSGEVVKAFVTLRAGYEPSEDLRLDLLGLLAASGSGRRSRRGRSPSTSISPTPRAARSCADCSRPESWDSPRATRRPWRHGHDRGEEGSSEEGQGARPRPRGGPRRAPAPPDAAHPAFRGALCRALQPLGHPRLPAPRDRRGGVRGGRHGGPLARRRGREHLPRARPRAGSRRLHAGNHGRTRGQGRGLQPGAGGSMHLFDAATRFYGGNAIVGGGLPLAVGLALADHLQGRHRVTACFFGDGAVAEGEFHESMNLAALWHLPVLFCCENNLYAMGTAIDRSESETDLSLKAASYRVPSWEVDGMDVLAVEEAAREAAGAVRAGGGPHFLELRTYRFRAHSMYDPDRYRDKAEIERWKERDPIPALTERLTAAGTLGEGDLERIDSRGRRRGRRRDRLRGRRHHRGRG